MTYQKTSGADASGYMAAIVTEALIKCGADGLCMTKGSSDSCSCTIDHLLECGEATPEECAAAYRHRLVDGRCRDCSRHCTDTGGTGAEYLMCEYPSLTLERGGHEQPK
jgi:hypothetical protein